LAQIQQQIDKLQREAESIKSKEVGGVIERIRDAIRHYGLTAQHLFGGKEPKAGRAKPAKRAAAGKKAAGKRGGSSRKGVPVPVKYRDDAGNTWTGRGNRPRWLVAALNDGKRLEDFALKN
jgi:DNA-binding protein H-NS